MIMDTKRKEAWKALKCAVDKFYQTTGAEVSITYLTLIYHDPMLFYGGIERCGLFWGQYQQISHSWTDRLPITDISKIFKSCILLHYQKYNVFYDLLLFKKIFKSGFMS